MYKRPDQCLETYARLCGFHVAKSQNVALKDFKGVGGGGGGGGGGGR